MGGAMRTTTIRSSAAAFIVVGVDDDELRDGVDTTCSWRGPARDRCVRAAEEARDLGVFVTWVTGSSRWGRDEAVVDPRDEIVVRSGASAFHATNLEWSLRSQGVHTVLIAGFHTETDVEATVRSAYDRDFNVVVVRDCCGTDAAASADLSLESGLPGFARIRDWSQVRELLREDNA